MTLFVKNTSSKPSLSTALTSLVVAAAAFGGVSTASASSPSQPETFRVEFTFASNAPVEDIYADFRRTARKACQQDVGDLIRMRFERACASDLLDKAVQMTGEPSLIALHRQRAGYSARVEQVSNR